MTHDVIWLLTADDKSSSPAMAVNSFAGSTYCVNWSAATLHSHQLEVSMQTQEFAFEAHPVLVYTAMF